MLKNRPVITALFFLVVGLCLSATARAFDLPSCGARPADAEECVSLRASLAAELRSRLESCRDSVACLGTLSEDYATREGTALQQLFNRLDSTHYRGLARDELGSILGRCGQRPIPREETYTCVLTEAFQLPNAINAQTHQSILNGQNLRIDPVIYSRLLIARESSLVTSVITAACLQRFPSGNPQFQACENLRGRVERARSQARAQVREQAPDSPSLGSEACRIESGTENPCTPALMRLTTPRILSAGIYDSCLRRVACSEGGQSFATLLSPQGTDFALLRESVLEGQLRQRYTELKENLASRLLRQWLVVSASEIQNCDRSDVQHALRPLHSRLQACQLGSVESAFVSDFQVGQQLRASCRAARSGVQTRIWIESARKLRGLLCTERLLERWRLALPSQVNLTDSLGTLLARGHREALLQSCGQEGLQDAEARVRKWLAESTPPTQSQMRTRVASLIQCERQTLPPILAREEDPTILGALIGEGMPGNRMRETGIYSTTDRLRWQRAALNRQRSQLRTALTQTLDQLCSSDLSQRFTLEELHSLLDPEVLSTSEQNVLTCTRETHQQRGTRSLAQLFSETCIALSFPLTAAMLVPGAEIPSALVNLACMVPRFFEVANAQEEIQRLSALRRASAGAGGLSCEQAQELDLRFQLQRDNLMRSELIFAMQVGMSIREIGAITLSLSGSEARVALHQAAMARSGVTAPAPNTRVPTNSAQ